MEQIINHNCAGLCSEKYCGEVETYFITLDIQGLKFLVGFCDKHAQEFEEKLIKSKEMTRKISGEEKLNLIEDEIECLKK